MNPTTLGIVTCAIGAAVIIGCEAMILIDYWRSRHDPGYWVRQAHGKP